MFKGSWKTTVIGILGFLTYAAPEVVKLLQSDTFDVKTFGIGLFMLTIGYFSRDWDKTSEDEGIKPQFSVSVNTNIPD